MKKYLYLVFGILVFIALVYITTSFILGSAGMNQKLSINEAEKLVRDYIFREKPSMNPNVEFSLKETTTNKIWQKMNAQVFKIKEGSHMEGQDYIIKNGTVSALGSYWGGGGIFDMKVEDLNKDGKLELLYYYYTGSGISRLIEGIYYDDGNIQEKVIDIIR